MAKAKEKGESVKTPKKKAKTRKEMCATPATGVLEVNGQAVASGDEATLVAAAERSLDSLEPGSKLSFIETPVLATEPSDADVLLDEIEKLDGSVLPNRASVEIVGEAVTSECDGCPGMNAESTACGRCEEKECNPTSCEIANANSDSPTTEPTDLPALRRSEHFRTPVNVIDQSHGDTFSLYNADTCEAIKALPSACADLSIYSPPFASLYTYSASDRDLGNCRTHDDFHEHFGFLMPEMLRVTKPGREMCVHCMDLPTSKTRDGYIGLTDFPGTIIRAAEQCGWIFHARITIWKDPVTAVQRTKAIGLLHKQLMKDSTMSRVGIPDYVLVFRKPGDNAIPVVHTDDDLAILPPFGHDQKWKSVEQWQKWASPVWFDIDPNDTLQYRSAREEADERHVCPLQLEVIRRCMTLWSNPGEVVLSPFAGIGSEGVVSVENGRKYIGFELKRSYYEQAARNLAAAEPKARGAQMTLF